MRSEDRLPVLAFARPDTPPPPAPPPAPVRTATDPDDLARAIAALRGALEAEVGRPRPTRLAPDVPDRHADSFSPVGVPKPHRSKPRWRAGADLPEQGPTPDGPLTVTGASQVAAPDPDRDPLARRITAIHLPRFAMDRWLRWCDRRGDPVPQDMAVALAVEGTHGPVIHATNRAADLAGIQRGARVVDMRALCPDLRVDFADTGADRAALERLMLWARRWCPWTAMDGIGFGAAGLVLDTTGSDHLWGGEAAMLREIEGRLAMLGFDASLAVAPTHGAAWALSRLGGLREVCEAEALAARMAALPVRALRLDPDTVLLLQRLGLKSVGDLAAVPRISLARRFSRAPLAENPLLRLDQMMGRLAEPVSSPDDPPRFAVQAALPEPVQDPTAWLPALCEELCAGLAAAGFGARRVRVTVYRTDGEVSSVEVATSQPSRDAAHLLRLFDGKLDRIDPGFGFDLITLAASVAEHLGTAQRRLDGGTDEAAAMAQLIDRLTARLGAGAVRRPALNDSHIPERRELWQAAMAAGAVAAPPPLTTARPVRIFDHPEEVRVLYAVPEGPPAQFAWRRLTHKVARFAGPERVAPEWWADKPGTRLRDYYRIEDHHGRRFWLYRDGVLGDDRGETPRWFLHGVFA